MNSFRAKLWNFIKSLFDFIFRLVIVMILATLLMNYVVEISHVSGQSMENTLNDKDYVISEKVSYRFSDPERFDIIVFPIRDDAESDERLLIKRIIGLPGETIQIDEEGNIYINGEILEEDYGKETIKSAGLASDPITLRDNEYFVMGDNRNNSLDSRSRKVGTVTRDQIRGHVVLRIWPFKLL